MGVLYGTTAGVVAACASGASGLIPPLLGAAPRSRGSMVGRAAGAADLVGAGLLGAAGGGGLLSEVVGSGVTVLGCAFEGEKLSSR